MTECHNTQKAHEAKLAGMFMSILAVDIAQFFPSIQPHIAVEIYQHQGFPRELVQFLGSYLSNCHTTYKIGNANSEEFEVLIGIPQGCKICPIAACLYIALALKTLTPWDSEAHQFLMSFIDHTLLAIMLQSLEANPTYSGSKNCPNVCSFWKDWCGEK